MLTRKFNVKKALVIMLISCLKSACKTSFIFCILATIHVTLAHADDWFTGPIFALPGEAMPLGQSNLQLFNFQATGDAVYNAQWQRVSIPTYTVTQFSPQFTYGLADHADVDIEMYYFYNQNEHKFGNNLGDSNVILGYQIIEQAPNKHPAVRLTLEEIFPTGHYDRLDPFLAGADITGQGSYQTTFGINTQYLLHINANHDLNAHACLYYNYANTVKLNGFSVYGGNVNTRGYINPGNSVTIDLAGEYTLNQNWVAVLEGLLTYQEASTFRGTSGLDLSNSRLTNTDPHTQKLRKHHIPLHVLPTRHNIGNVSEIGSGNLDNITISPALEYNFSDNIGIIGGAWFTIAGKNTPEFVSSVIALSISW